MQAYLVTIGEKYTITYPNEYHNRRHFGKVVTAVKALPCGDYEVKFKNGVRFTYHATWLEPVEKQS